MGQEVLLQMTDICKEFPGVKALDHVSLTVKKGTVHALMGENGAGKSTLMKCLFGIYSKDAGKIELEGKEVNFKNSREALNNGVAMVHQELNQALKRNVMDNIWLGRYPMTAGIMVNEHKMLEDTNKIFEELGIAVDPKRIMSTMPVSQRQMVEIAKAVSYNSKIIVFDEPTSSLTEEEVEHLFKIINMLRDRGCGIIYISHKMAEILRIADEVTVMRDGTWIATEPAQNLTTDKIIKLMVGRELTNQFPPKTNKPGEVALEVEHLSARYSLLQDVSFKARKGEIVGLAGLDGSGRTETLENIFGVATRKDGVIKLDGKEVRNRNARESIKNGFALLTEERRATGIFGILNIRENTVISSLKKHKKAGFYLSDKSMEKDTAWAIDAMHIKTPSQKTKIRSLSGGNQQKVILGRWLLTEPEVLMLDEPTRGIDVGAKYEIYQLIIDLANKINGVKQNFADYKKLDSRDKKTYWKEFLLNNALYILLIVAIIYTYIQNSNFLSAASIVNIISLSAANLPIACGIAGCIVLTGTDLSAGRVVGLTACITASLMQSVTYATKMFPNLPVLPIPLVILIVLLVGGIVGWVNGFFVAKFQLHPFIVTLATQLIVYGLLLMYIMINGNNGQPLSGLDQHFNDVVKGSVISFNAGGARIAIPNYVWLAALIVVIMWFIWNKTTFGKNMFAVGSNPEAAKVSGVNVMRTTILVHTLAGAMYGLTGFIESSRIGSNTANTGLNYECDAIAACVIGGVSFVGGTGKISGVVLGVFLLRIIFVALNFLSINMNMQYVIKGLIILVACAIDMRKYLVRK